MLSMVYTLDSANTLSVVVVVVVVVAALRDGAASSAAGNIRARFAA